MAQYAAAFCEVSCIMVEFRNQLYAIPSYSNAYILFIDLLTSRVGGAWFVTPQVI